MYKQALHVLNDVYPILEASKWGSRLKKVGVLGALAAGGFALGDALDLGADDLAASAERGKEAVKATASVGEIGSEIAHQEKLLDLNKGGLDMWAAELDKAKEAEAVAKGKVGELAKSYQKGVTAMDKYADDLIGKINSGDLERGSEAYDREFDVFKARDQDMAKLGSELDAQKAAAKAAEGETAINRKGIANLQGMISDRESTIGKLSLDKNMAQNVASNLSRSAADLADSSKMKDIAGKAGGAVAGLAAGAAALGISKKLNPNQFHKKYGKCPKGYRHDGKRCQKL